MHTLICFWYFLHVVCTFRSADSRNKTQESYYSKHLYSQQEKQRKCNVGIPAIKWLILFPMT